jgi:hypothetical protein
MFPVAKNTEIILIAKGQIFKINVEITSKSREIVMIEKLQEFASEFQVET